MNILHYLPLLVLSSPVQSGPAPLSLRIMDILCLFWFIIQVPEPLSSLCESVWWLFIWLSICRLFVDQPNQLLPIL